MNMFIVAYMFLNVQCYEQFMSLDQLEIKEEGGGGDFLTIYVCIFLCPMFTLEVHYVVFRSEAPLKAILFICLFFCLYLWVEPKI